MGKRSRRTAAVRTAAATGGVAAPDAEVPVVGAREPCPCGSGRRYKACHGRLAAAAEPRLPRVARPFAGLPGEADWVAMREIVPAATAPLRLRADADVPGGTDRDVLLATVLPMAYGALVRASGQVVLALQTGREASLDAGRELGAALLEALGAEPGAVVPDAGDPGPGPRLQDLLDLSAPLQVEVHDDFGFWLDGVPDATPEVRESLDRANGTVIPTRRLTSADAAYWCLLGEREQVRWVLPHGEDEMLDPLARLHAAGGGGLGDGTRYLGAFRAHGLLVPVWDLPSGTGAEGCEERVAAYAERLAEAVADTSPLTLEQRRARSALQSRQLTLR